MKISRRAASPFLTLYREKLPDLDCHKWVLGPNDPPIGIFGYQKDDTTTQEFRVLSPAESKANEMNYGADVGTISVVVFREDKTPKKPLLVNYEQEDMLALKRGVFPKEPQSNLAVLQQNLRDTPPQDRGIIGQGAEKENQIRTVTFQADPVPVMSAVITYYKRG